MRPACYTNTAVGRRISDTCCAVTGVVLTTKASVVRVNGSLRRTKSGIPLCLDPRWMPTNSPPPSSAALSAEPGSRRSCICVLVEFGHCPRSRLSRMHGPCQFSGTGFGPINPDYSEKSRFPTICETLHLPQIRPILAHLEQGVRVHQDNELV